jgi:hypothetical protein
MVRAGSSREKVVQAGRMESKAARLCVAFVDAEVTKCWCWTSDFWQPVAWTCGVPLEDLGADGLPVCLQQQAALPFPTTAPLPLRQYPLGPPEQALLQQQPVEEQKTPKQKGLMEPLGHWHWKWGKPATSVMAAVNQPKTAQVVLPAELIMSP